MGLERPVEHVVDDLPHPLGVVDRLLRRERSLHECLEAIVAGRILGDQHVRAQIHRIGLAFSGQLVDEDDAALRGERFGVATNRPDVLVADHRPETGFVGEVAEFAPVQRVLTAEPGEDLVRWSLPPEVEIADVEVGEVRGLAQHAPSASRRSVTYEVPWSKVWSTPGTSTVFGTRDIQSPFV